MAEKKPDLSAIKTALFLSIRPELKRLEVNTACRTFPLSLTPCSSILCFHLCVCLNKMSLRKGNSHFPAFITVVLEKNESHRVQEKMGGLFSTGVLRPPTGLVHWMLHTNDAVSKA